MPLAPPILSAALVKVGLHENEPGAIKAWADAWLQYFGVASAGVPVNQKALKGNPLRALQGGLVGMSAPGGGPASIQKAITAFWGALAASPAAVFPAALIVIPPPGLSGIATAILGIISSNTSGNLPVPTAYLNLATAIHGCNVGGTATFPGTPPIVLPII